MNVRCPNCQTVFRVDPARVPETGIRARCSRCSATFTISRDGARPGGPGESGAAAPASGRSGEPGTPAPEPAAPEPAAPEPAAPAYAAATAPSSQDAPRPSAAPAQETRRPAAASQAGAAPAAAGGPPRTPVFGSRDPSARAQRIARALVSDIVAYHPKRRDECLEAGTLRTAFREEIMKSWEEYVAQVGLDMAKSTSFFRDALNDVLAKGQRIF